MNLKSSYKYQLSYVKGGAIAFYLIYLGVLIFNFCLAAVIINDGNMAGTSVNGTEMPTTIFIFVLGICSFREPFYMLVQNGISRKTTFLSQSLVLLTLSGAMAIVSTITNMVIRLVFSSGFNISFFQMLYQMGSKIYNTSTFAMEMLFTFFIMFAFAMLGMLLAAAFYRSGKLGRILVAAGIPITLFMILPVVDVALFNGEMMKKIILFIADIMGLTSKQPILGFITMTAVGLICSALTFLLVRKAPVKA